MDNQALLITLRLIHILGGIFWVGSALFLALFLFPVVRAVGPAGGQVMRGLMLQRKLPIYMNAAGGLSMLSGFWLYWRMMSLAPGWAGSGQGMVFGLGGAAAVLGAILGNAINARAAKRIAALGNEIQASGGPPSAEQSSEITALQKKLAKGLVLTTIFLTITAVCMAIARYV